MGQVLPFDAKNGAQDDRASASLEKIVDLTKAGMTSVNAEILKRAGSRVDLIPELARHLIGSGGKRLRPMLTIAASELCGLTTSADGGDDHVMLATVVEFMHTATLLHDDVVDESDMRRGKLAARKIWGNQASVLVGDYLLGQAFRMMVDVGSLGCLDILSTASMVIAEGEVMQLANTQKLSTSEDDYLDVVRAKTAALFAAATEVGAVLTDKDADARRALRSYGMNLGIAFQLIDDGLDFSGKQASLGKNIGDDFREGKITLPVVLGYRRGGEDDRMFWRRTLEEGEIGDGDVDHAIALLERSGAFDDTVARARHYGAMALDALAIFPPSSCRDAMTDVVEFCVERAC